MTPDETIRRQEEGQEKLVIDGQEFGGFTDLVVVQQGKGSGKKAAPYKGVGPKTKDGELKYLKV